MATDWNISTDIYNIVESVKNVQKRYIEDEDETTLSLGVFGFIADTEAKKIQTATIMAGQLGNEMFPARANLTKNVLAHATFNGITDINAVPAKMDITLCVKISDLDKYLVDGLFYLSEKSAIFIGNVEFHLDYDVKIKKIKIKDGSYSYSAQYVTVDENDKPIVNRLASITHPYLKQPFIITIDGYDYIGIQCTIRQCTIEETNDTMVSDSIIENKSYTFEYDNQIADFKVIVTDQSKQEEIEVVPYMYGSVIDPDDDYYCWYQFTANNTVRITFDSKSYIPGLNNEIYIKAYTTLGADGNFEYLDIDGYSEGLFLDISAPEKGYNSITVYIVGLTDSVDGSDRKSKEELQKLLPKAAMSRGSITTETDLNNYFNLINTDSNRLVMQKKVDNQLNRIWYGYFLLKDDNNNIIPTNTVKGKIALSDTRFVSKSDDGRFIIPAGTDLRYDPSTGISEPISSALVPAPYSDDFYNSGYYYYKTVYNTVICVDPLYAAYYLTIVNSKSYFLYDYVNNNSDIQFIANRYSLEKKLLTDQGDYRFGFNIIQSVINSNVPLISVESVAISQESGGEQQVKLVTENLKVVLVLYKEGKPYRWKECTYLGQNSKPDIGIYYFEALIGTDETMDDKNRLKITGCNEVGGTKNIYGYIDEDCEASIYILANIEVSPDTEYPRKDLDNIAPGYQDYTVTNIYKCTNGLDFFRNYTGVTNTKIEPLEGTDTVFYISGLPVVGSHYLSSNDNANLFIEQLKEKKSYIDYCLELVENSMVIDFKFFNTYGESKTFKLEDETTSINAIDITMRWKLSLKDSSDITTRNDIIQSIKNSIENLNNIEDLHIPNLITEIINEYQDRIHFIEFVGFNKFGADDQHIIKVDDGNPFNVPEFINVRNTVDYETNEILPSIEIKLV